MWQFRPTCGATSDQRVRVNHRAIIDVRTGIDEHWRHARDTTSDEGAVANTGSPGTTRTWLARLIALGGYVSLSKKGWRKAVD